MARVLPRQTKQQITAKDWSSFTDMFGPVLQRIQKSDLASLLPARRKQRSRRKMLMSLGLASAGGALLMYLLDPDRGRSRRAKLADQTGGTVRTVGRKAERLSRFAGAEAHGKRQKLAHLKEEKKTYDDATLAQKVRSELFSSRGMPRAPINISAEAGTVVLVGEVDRPSLIKKAERLVRKMEGVSDVKNLLHASGTPAPQA